MDFSALIKLALQISIVGLVFALGLGTGFRDALWVFGRPRRLLIGTAAMFVVMPLVAAALALLFPLEPAVKLVLVAIALSPVPPFLPGKEFKAGAEPSHVVGLFVAAGVLAILLIPIGTELIAGWFGLDIEVAREPFTRVVAMTVLLPLAAGILIRQLMPRLAERLAHPLAKAATLLLVVAVLPILFRSFPAMLELIGNGTLAAFAAFVAIGLLVGHVAGAGLGEDRIVLALSTASRHPGVALAIAAVAASGIPDVGPAVLLYLIVGAVLSGVYLAWIGRRDAAGGSA